VICCSHPQADIVTSITFVDGRGQVRTVSRNGAIGRALSGGLGMLGIITEVTLRLQPGLSKTRTWAIGPQPDTAVATELPSLIVSSG
jgi:FAD/FMN-containing dehydrogenase